jgi:TolB-like protein
LEGATTAWDPIESSGDRIRLSPALVEADTQILELALERGDAESLALAALLYRGDLLDGLALHEAPFEDWLATEQGRLRRRTLQALTGELERRVEGRDVEGALGLGERLLEIDPAAEEVHRALIRLDLDRCVPGSAIRRYERLSAVLAGTLGVAPSAESRALLAEIRAIPARPWSSRSSAGRNPGLSPERSDPARPGLPHRDPGEPPTVAVLPFADRTPTADRGHLALGFAEELVRALARFRSLRVLATQSSFALADPREAGARLGAHYCLAGSLAASGERLRISAELLDTASGHCLWSERREAQAPEVFAAQDEIAGSVAAALAVHIDGDLLRQAARKPPEDLATYDLWLRGLARLRQGTPESLTQARPLFEQALRIDPGFARAYTGLSLSHFNEWSCIAWERWDENERLAYDYAEQGAGLDGADHLTQLVLGRILLYRREFERAERHLARAEALNPNDADMLAQLAYSDACLGDAERGLQRAELARRLNPFHDDWYFAFAAGASLLARRLPETIDLAARAPQSATDMHAYLACAQAHLGRLDDARRHRDAFLALFGRRICPQRRPAPDEPMRWLLRVNPIRLDSDRALLVEGLAKSGLPVPADLGPAG